MHCRNFFSGHQVNLCGSYEGTPSLPQRGRQPEGSTPLTPNVRGIFINLPRAVTLLGDALAAGAGARCAGAPRSDFFKEMCYISS